MSIYWIRSAPYEDIPRDAVRGGTDIDGSKIYVGRAFYEGDQVACKFIPRHQMYRVSYVGKEHNVTNFDYLTGEGFCWAFSRNGAVPLNAVTTGLSRNGESLYIGRCLHENSLQVGKVQQSRNGLLIPFGFEELLFREYEVLINPYVDSIL
uniref:Uncharacterized protein n=1 Tax=Megaselia scalaris TaxID=36166 RepID=T1GJE0_MEGSC